MSTDPDKNTPCPDAPEKPATNTIPEFCGKNLQDENQNKNTKKTRTVSFPDDDQLVTEYYESTDPWQNVQATTRAQLAADYLEACRRHNTPPIECVLQQIRELPENSLGGGTRAPRLVLSECSMPDAASVDALEVVFSKVQFRRVELDHVIALGDEGAEALFDMIEYYESTTSLCISGPRRFGSRGWQAASRLIRRSCELIELELSSAPLEGADAQALARALRPHTCGLRALCLPRCRLAGTPLLELVIALKTNMSVRELRLGDNNLKNADAQQLASLLKINLRLQLLDLSNNEIEDIGVHYISGALIEQANQTPPSAGTSPLSPHHCPLMGGYDSRGLAFLVLWNNQLSRTCALFLNKMLRYSKSLCVLNVGHNDLGAEVIRALSTGGALVSLGLQAAGLGPEVAPALPDLLRAFTRLQRLDLRENNLGVEGLQALVTAMKENTTLTQIDLDDPAESSASLSPADTEAALVSRLTRDVRALCRRNEPPATSPERRPHRKISLTCHTACLARGMSTSGPPAPPAAPPGAVCEEERRGRLRSPLPSPAPSPAGSPVPPHLNQSRFSVTRVTPERESSTESSSPSTPTRPLYCPTSSRFRVVQVAEPPQIQVHPATTSQISSRPSSSRFSVTRNYDSVYNPTVEPVKTETRSAATKKVHGPTTRAAEKETVPGQLPSINAEDIMQPVASRSEVSQTDIINLPTIPRNSSIEVKTSQPNVTRSKSDVEASSEMIQTDDRSISYEMAARLDSLPSFTRSQADEYEVTTRPEGYSEVTSPEVSQPHTTSKIENKTKSEAIQTDFSDIIMDLKEPELNKSDKSLGSEAISTKQIDVANPNLDLEKVSTGTTKIEVKPTSSDINEVSTKETAEFIPDSDLDKVRDDTKSTMESPELKRTESKIDIELDKSDQNARDAKYVTGSESINSDKIVCSELKTVTDKTDHISHSEEIENDVTKTETRLVKNRIEMCEGEKRDIKVEVTVKTESQTKNSDQNEFRNIDEVVKRDETAIKQIEAITVDLGNLIQEMKHLTTKTSNLRKDVKNECTQADSDVNIDTFANVPVNIIQNNVVLKKNKSESSLDSPDLEVSRLMNKKMSGSPFCDSSSSLEISGSSVESLNALDQNTVHVTKPIIIQEAVESDTELDRRKPDHVALSTESSIESNTSEVTPVNCSNYLNMSVSSNESVSPIIFGKSKKIHDSLSSLEASVSSLDSGKQEKVMVTSADSGIEYSLRNPSESKDDNSSNEGTLTNNSSLKESVKKPDSFHIQDTLTSPKRTSSLLDVPALKNKGVDRMKKTSWVPPSPSFHIPRPEPEKEIKLPSHLEKLLSLFQHPSSLFSRSSNEDDKKSASSTPPRKDSSLTSSFWSWGSGTEKEKEEKEDRDSSSETTDSTLSERVQVSFVDESFSKKLDSKTPSTDTDNTLSEFQTFQPSTESEASQDLENRVNPRTTDEFLVQKCLVVSSDSVGSNGNARASDNVDLSKPNDLNKNVVCDTAAGDSNKNPGTEDKIDEVVRPRSFAAVLKSSGSENSLEKQTSPDTGQPVDKLPSKIIRGIKENISPENTLTSSMSNTKALVIELTEKQTKIQPIVSTVWEVMPAVLSDSEISDIKIQTDLAPIATIEETCDIDVIADMDDKNTSTDSGVTLESIDGKKVDMENVDVGKDALSYLIYENRNFDQVTEVPQSLAQEMQEAEIKKMLDLSPELIIDEAVEVPVFTAKGLNTSPVIPERAKLKKANSLEELSKSEEKESPKAKTIMFKMPDIATTPRDIPERKSRLRTRSGSSPKSLPECLNKPCPLTKMDNICKRKKKVSSLGKMARDSLLALNMSEEEIAEFRKSYKLTSVESLKSLESVSEDANSQSGNSIDSRCRSCLRMSQESLMSLDSITEDCRCTDDCDKAGQSNR